jgi:hypothetical protein
MAPNDFLSAAGPMWGPNFVLVTANDENGRKYQLQLYPDARNAELKAAGLAQQYYFQPGLAYVAKKLDSPDDYDFGMTVFKGLMTSETTVGVDAEETTNGTLEAGGGFCTFSTTFAVPESVLANAVEKLENGEHDDPPDRLAHLFRFDNGDPAPRIGMIPISESNVTIAVPDLVQVGPAKSPMFISAQGAGKGSIEARGRNAFLVTCNQLAAGAIAGSLKTGAAPFVVNCELKEQFYLEACKITVEVDVDKAYDSVSTAVSAGGFLGISSASLNAAYSSMRTNGGITTKIEMNSGVLTPELKQWIETSVDDIRKKAWEMVKKDIFDWDPSQGDTPASASESRGLIGGLFGGASVALKANFQRRSIKYQETIELTDTVTIVQSVDADLNDMMASVSSDLDKYLAVIDIGEYFKKLQVAGMCAIDFDGTLSDGTALRDPIVSAQLECAYPDYTDPLVNGKVNLVTRGQGFHYTIGKKDPNGGIAPVVWSADNAKDIVDVSWLRLDKDVDGWPADQVRLRKTLIYDGSDPRVDLSNGGLKVTFEEDTSSHAPILDAGAVGYVYVHFVLDRILPKDNISILLKPTIGGRTDALTITRENQKNVLWEIFSDKFIDETGMSYELEVEITGPGFADDPITYGTGRPVTIALPQGRVKYVNPLKLTLPPVPADKVAQVNRYIAEYPAA